MIHDSLSSLSPSPIFWALIIPSRLLNMPSWLSFLQFHPPHGETTLSLHEPFRITPSPVEEGTDFLPRHVRPARTCPFFSCSQFLAWTLDSSAPAPPPMLLPCFSYVVIFVSGYPPTFTHLISANHLFFSLIPLKYLLITITQPRLE